MFFNRMRFSTSLIGLLAVGCSVAGSTYAADTTADAAGDADTGGTVIVKGDRKWQKATTVAKEQAQFGNDVQVISSAQVEQSGAINFAEAVQFLVKGVNVGYSPDEGEYTIRLDGGGDRDTLVTLDGTPLYDRGPALENIWGATTIDNHLIENIEVYRGGNSLYFGSNGGIGVVNVITKKPDGTTKGDFGISYGSFQTREIWGNYSFPLDRDGKHSIMFFGSAQATDGPRIFDPSKFTDNVALSGGIQKYPLNKNDIGVKYLWQIDADTSLRAGAIYTESWFQDPFPSGESYSPNTLRYPIMDAAFSKKWGDKVLLEASVYYSNPKLWNAEVYPEICQIKPATPYVPGTPVPNTCVNPNDPKQTAAFPNGTPTIPYGAWTGAVEPAFGHGFGTSNQYKSGFKEKGATVRTTWNMSKYLEVVGGVQWVSYADDSDQRFAIPDNNSTTTGVFVDFHPKLPFSPGTNISLAVREDFSNAFDHKNIWKFGIKQPFLTDFYIRANGGTSYSLPQTNELYINNPRPATATLAGFTVIGNPDLAPEETETYNAAIGYSHDFGNIQLYTEVGGFNTEITNRITSTSGRPVSAVFNGVSTPVDTYYNDGAVVKILGLTAEVDLKVGDQWHFNAGYTNQDASPLSGSKKGLQIGETPAWFATTAIDWTSANKRLKLQLLTRFQGAEFATGGPAIPGTTKAAVGGKGADSGVPRYRYNFGDYTVTNATLTYMMGENMQHRLQFRVVNLFDTYYAERYGYGNNFYGAAFNRGEYSNTDDRYYYAYPFEGKPRSFYVTFATNF